MKGICFKEPLFRKVVNGGKTQTRRIIFPDTDYTYFSQPTFLGMHTDPDGCYKLNKEGEMISYKDGEPKMFTFKGTFGLFEGDQFNFDNSYVRPRYQPGEIVYLKEPYAFEHVYPCAPIDHPNYNKYRVVYAFDKTPLVRSVCLWNNKLFMPEKYARHFIQITDVTAQKIRDITNEDAWCEGVSDSPEYNCLAMFQNVWISIYGFSSWLDNPWVWKYTFERQAVTEGLVSFILNSK